MWCVVSLFVILNLYLTVLGTDSSYNIVRWNVTEQFKGASSFDLPKTGVILKNKPLHIILHNFDVPLTDVSCQNKLYVYKFEISPESKIEDGKHNLIIKVNYVTEDMSTEWECRVWTFSQKYQSFTFKIRIKGKERVRVTVGRLELTYTQTEPSQMEYDGVAEYWYNDGEAVDLVCARHVGSTYRGYLRLTYYNGFDEMLFTTDEISFEHPVNFRKILKVENIYDYADCIYTSITKIKYTYRTKFKLKFETTSLNPLKMTVNNLKLVPARSDSVRAEYQYKFYEGQMLTITCETDQHLLTNLSLRFDPHLDVNFLKDSENVPWRTTKQLYTNSTLNSQNLRCVSNDSSTQYSAELLLLLDQTDPIIVGLTPSDVIHQYSRSFATWVIDYQYTVNQKLNLTCVAKKPNAKYQWSFKKKSDIRTSGPDRNQSFALKEAHNGSSIVCDTLYTRAIIKLHIKPGSAVDYISNKDEERMIIVISAVAVSAVALVTVCFTIWCRLRRNKGVRQESRENLTRVLETPIPTYPNQWDTSEDNIDTQEDLMVTNSLYGVDCAPLYARPQKKTKRTAEPLYQSIEPVYNVPSSEGVDDVSVVNNAAKSVPQGVNLTYSNARGDGNHSQLGNNKETYDYVSSSNNSTRDYVEPLYSEVVWPQ